MPSGENLAMERFHSKMTLSEAFSVHPAARQIFAYFHIGGCHHCSVDESMTIEQACHQYGVPVEILLEQLNKLPVPGSPAGKQEK